MLFDVRDAFVEYMFLLVNVQLQERARIPNIFDLLAHAFVVQLDLSIKQIEKEKICIFWHRLNAPASEGLPRGI